MDFAQLDNYLEQKAQKKHDFESSSEEEEKKSESSQE